MRSLRRTKRVLALILVLFGTLPLSVVSLAQGGSPPSLTARPAVAVARFDLDTPWDSRARAMKPAEDGDKLVSVIVKLDIAPLASYAGGVPGLAATTPGLTGAVRLDSATPDSLRYLGYLDQRQRDFESRALTAIPQVRVLAR
jgi:hypothetical protein